MKKIVVFLTLLIHAMSVYAADFKFGWNTGNFKFHYDVVNHEFGGNIECFHFMWLINNYFSVGFYAFDFRSDDKISILPVEAAFVPFSFADIFYFSIYGKGGWQLTEEDDEFRNGYFVSAGTQFFLFFDSFVYYSPYISVFAEYEYNNRHYLKIGIGIDLLIFFAATRESGRGGGHRHSRHR